MASNNKLYELLAPIIEEMGYECWGIEYLKQGAYSILRIYIDKEAGILIEDCEQVSHQISAFLDVEDPINGEYSLEVSSPGLDRILFTLEQIKKFQTEKMKLETYKAYDKRKRFIGKIDKIEEEEIFFVVDNQTYQINYNDIAKAKIVPTF